MVKSVSRNSRKVQSQVRFLLLAHGNVTKTGKVLTDEDIEALADEAEAGYDIRPCGGMADTVDSKSIASRRVGSTPTKVTKPL